MKILGLFLLGVAVSSSLDAASIDGRWATEFDTQVGVQKYVFDLTAQGAGLTGQAAWERMGEKGVTPITEGKISGNQVSFVEIMAFEDLEVPAVYQGTLAGDEIKFTRTIGDFGSEDFVAKRVGAGAGPGTAPPQFQATWASLAAGYRVPDWFRDAKFGIWAHWTAQCVPEQGDWYARNMYIQGTPDYAYHLAHYGHPSKFGFMEIDHLWTAAHWDPEMLMDLYQRAGAKYFVALANHHDNFDAYDSKYQPWNSVNVGPKVDIVGTWAKIARAHGLRFGVSNHSSHAWHWFQPAYGHDVEGPLAGVPYDAATLTKADGKGKWWDGLDPQDLYCGLRLPMPMDLKTTQAAEAWHWANDGHWYESVPPNDNGYTEKWFLRAQDLLDKYHPDLLYFDDDELPLGQAGLDIAAHFYNANQAFHGGHLEAVLNSKHLSAAHKPAMVQDIERGVSEGIRPEPWQTDTCIGSWHYERRLFLEHKYKTVDQVVHMLVDIVSKNGNLLLSIPLRGDGSIDEDERAFLQGMARWMDVNSEAIFGTRPWTVYGEGPSTVAAAQKGPFGGARDVQDQPYTAADVRFTTKDGALYATLFAWPADGRALVTALGVQAPASARVTAVALLGYSGSLTWTQDGAGLHVTLPAAPPCEHAFVLKISGVLPARPATDRGQGTS